MLSSPTLCTIFSLMVEKYSTTCLYYVLFIIHSLMLIDGLLSLTCFYFLVAVYIVAMNVHPQVSV